MPLLTVSESAKLKVKIGAAIDEVTENMPPPPPPPPPPPLPTVMISMSPATLEDSHSKEHSAMLVWQTENADTVTINGEEEMLDGTRQLIGKDVGSYPFHLIAVGLGGVVEKSVTLTVIAHSHPSPTPHPDNPEMQLEHFEMLKLTRRELATHVMQRSGAYSDPATWGGMMPTNGSRLWIPDDMEIEWDDVINVRHKSIGGNGKLTVTRQRPTRLIVDTFGVDTKFVCDFGTVASPLTHQCEVIIANMGPLDPATDPLFLGRGLISHGTFFACGAYVTPWVELARDPRAGDRQLILTSPVVNWKMGETLILPKMFNRDQDDFAVIESINGTTVNLVEPLEYDHPTLRSSRGVLVVPLAINPTRNVVFRSESKTERGHIMMMHNNRVHVENVAALDLGRTNKKVLATHPKIGDSMSLANPIGRYTWHFHLAGVSGMPAMMKNVVGMRSPGLVFVNHDSNAIFNSCFAYNAVTGFLCERGPERGSFTNCLAGKMHGTGQHGQNTQDRIDAHDLAHGGHSFWTQAGGGVPLVNCAGWDFLATGFEIHGLGSGTVTADRMPEGANSLEAQDVPNHITDFRSWAPAGNDGATTWGLHNFHYYKGDQSRGDTHIDGLKVHHGMVDEGYVGHLHYKDLEIIGDVTRLLQKFGLAHSGVSYGKTIEDGFVEGYVVGLATANENTNAASLEPGTPSRYFGGYYNNAINFLILNATGKARTLSFDGIEFGTLPPEVLEQAPSFGGWWSGGRQQYDLFLACWNFHYDVRYLYRPDFIHRVDWWPYAFDTPNYVVHSQDVIRRDGRYVSYPELGKNHSLAPYLALPDVIRLRPDGMPRDNEMLRNDLGLYFLGQVLPEDVSEEPRTRGIYHDEPATVIPALTLVSDRVTKQSNYTLTVKDSSGMELSTMVQLQPGWNVPQIEADGYNRGVAIRLDMM